MLDLRLQVSDSRIMADVNAAHMRQRRFLVALSFPGERREFIAGVARVLADRYGQDKVLYDEFHEAELARPDLDIYLGRLYREHSELVVPFYCVDYERKKWCKLEWRQMRDIIVNAEEHRIMPFRFDDTPVPGVLSIDGYIRVNNRSAQEIAELIIERMALNETTSGQGSPKSDALPPANRAPIPLPSIEAAIASMGKPPSGLGRGSLSFYLFSSFGRISETSPASVFYKVEGKAQAELLCGLFRREYADAGGLTAFHYVEATAVSIEEQVLLEEALDLLSTYSDPDPGLYEPEPSREMLLRAQYALRAGTWEALLRGHAAVSQEPAPSTGDTNRAATDQLPTMPPLEWRNAGLGLLMLLAQVYYRILECIITQASWFVVLDLELNQSYLWAVESISNLLKNHEDLKDFPMAFEPIFPDLYPSTIRDVDWDDMVAPDAERFLSTVQKYVHSKGLYEPEKNSPAWRIIELFRPSVDTAIERAIAYHTRIDEHRKRVFGS